LPSLDLAKRVRREMVCIDTAAAPSTIRHASVKNS
jgi:hypothetical protein